MKIPVPSLRRAFQLAIACPWIGGGFAAWAQAPDEFPIATTATPEFSLGLAFDGTNFLVGIQGIGGRQSTVGAQLLSQSGNKLGPVISTGRTGGAPFVAYGGGQYLIVWADDPQSPNSDIWGMLIAPNGTHGSPFPISTDAADEDPHGIAFDGARFLVGCARDVGGDLHKVFGRFVTPAGIVDSEIQISTAFGSHGDVGAIAFNGSNYLVAWCEDQQDQEIRARLVAPNGALGTEFSVYSTTHPADGATGVASDGSSFLVMWSEETGGINTGEFDVQAQLVDAAGVLSGGVIPIANGPNEQGAPFAAFDGTNYLVTWSDYANDVNKNHQCDPGEGLCVDVFGRFVSRTGALVGSAFPVTKDPGDQYVSPVAFGSSRYLCAWISGPGGLPDGELLGGDVFGTFLADPLFGNVLYKNRIANGAGGLPSGTISGADEFAKSLTPLGDLDGDGIGDLAAGSPYDNDGPGTDRGAVYVLFLNRNGSAHSFQKISDTAGGFTGVLDDNDIFGFGSAALGDLDGDSIGDLAVGAPGDDDGAGDSGAVWVLFLNANGTVKGHQKISNGTGGFTGTLLANDEFGASLEGLGDLDGDGVEDLAVGAHHDDDGGTNRGAVWILFLNPDGTVKAHQKISDTAGSFTGTLADGDELGRSVAVLGNLDGAGGSVLALAVGAPLDDQAGADAGAVWVLFLGSSGSVSSFTKITEGTAGFAGDLGNDDRFGLGLESLGDVGGPGVRDLAIGASRDDDGGTDRGAVWILSLDAAGSTVAQQKVSATSGNFGADLADGDAFGVSIAALGDLDRDGRNDMAVGAFEQTTSQSRGAVWICFLNDGTLTLGASATTWTGATSTKWELASNWGNGTPTATKTAIIPDAATTPRDPSVTVSGQQCNALWIQSGGTLDVSAGADSLGVFGGATVSGPITGTGEFVFDAPGTLAGDGTIGVSFAPFAVRADADLGLQGGPLSVTGSFAGSADVQVASGATIDIGGTVQVASDLAIDGSITIGDGVTVGGTLASSSSGGLTVMGSGTCVAAGQICFHGDVTTSCSLGIERSTTDTSELDLTNGWPADVMLDAAGTVNLLTADLVIGGDFLLQNGTLGLGVDGKITTGGANGIRIADADSLEPIALLDLGDHTLQVPALAGITVGNRGKLNVGSGGELQLAGALTVESGGTLSLDGVPADPASITGHLGNRFALALAPGSTLAAKGFAFRGMTASGIGIGPDVTLAAAPFDLRGGLFDEAAPGGVLLDIVRSAPTQLRYLRFDDSFGAAGVRSVRTTLASSPITLVNWSGDLAPDAATAETFDDDPGESSPPERIVWAPPESSDVQDFTASWGPGYVRTTWQSLSEVDSESFLVQRSPEPPGLFTPAGEMPSAGPGGYELHVFGSSAFAASRYRLYECLTHGELRLIDEVMLPASDIVLRPGGNAPAPPGLPPQPIVVGPGGAYSDMPTALLAFARSGQSSPVTLELARGTHEPFVIGRGLAFDLRLVAHRGAVIDASRAPVRIEMLSSERVLELVGIVVDARRGLQPALEVENAQGVVLLQDVRARGSAGGPAVRLVSSRAVIVQGGAIEDVLVLESRSRATASGTRIGSLELTGRSALETRGASPAAFVEPGSSWLAHASAPRLHLSASTATLEAEGGGLAWLGLARGLGFTPSTRPLLEGLLLLDPAAYSGLGPLRLVLDGRASWRLDPMPGVPVYLQAFVLDPGSGRISLSDVVRSGDDH